MAADEGVDLLWTTRNAFYVGAHQAAIAEAADLDGLGEADRLERDVFVYRAYVELGSYEVSVTRLRGGRGRGYGGRGAMVFPPPLPRCARDWARKAARSLCRARTPPIPLHTHPSRRVRAAEHLARPCLVWRGCPEHLNTEHKPQPVRATLAPFSLNLIIPPHPLSSQRSS